MDSLAYTVIKEIDTVESQYFGIITAQCNNILDSILCKLP